MTDLTAGLRETRDPGYLYHSRALAFLKLGKRELARRDFERVIQAPAQGALGYSDRGDAFEKLGDPEQAARDFAAARRMAPSNEGVLNHMAWQEATSSRPELRDGKAAVRDATRACQTSKWRDANIIDTLAAAYAEAGDFSRALSYEREAIALTTMATDRNVLQKHLALFQQSKPVREDLTIQ